MQRDVNTNTSTQHQACASCKHQRKRCSQDCILAPYFPANKTREFQAVHKVFGVSNLSKMIRGVKEEDRKRVVDSLTWEAFCRQKDPVLGSFGEYKRIQNELKTYKSFYPMPKDGVNYSLMNNNKGLIAGVNGGLDFNYNGTNVIHGHEKSTSDFCYDLRYIQGPEELKQEREFGHVAAPLHQQQNYPMHGFNQHYYNLPGQFPF